MSKSPRFSLSGPDWPSIGKSLLLGLAGAVSTYLIEWSRTTDLGEMTPIVAAAIPVLINILWKFVSGPTE